MPNNNDYSITNLCLIKSNHSLYALKWDFECKTDELVQFEVECTNQTESEDGDLEKGWRLYGRTNLLCFPILTHRLNYGQKYKFRVYCALNNNSAVGVKSVCDTLVEANEISGVEFSCALVEETKIIREIVVRSFQDTQTIEDRENDHYLKSFDSVFDGCDYKLWVPFKSTKTINEFYDENTDYTLWTVKQKLLEKDGKDHENVRKAKIELNTALTQTMHDEYHFNIGVHIFMTTYITDDFFDTNTKVGHSFAKTRQLLSEIWLAMLGVSKHITDRTQKTVAIRDAFVYFLSEIQLIADRHHTSLELVFHDLYVAYSCYVIEANERHKFHLTADDYVDNSMPEMNHFLCRRHFNGGMMFFLYWNALVLNYKIPAEVKKHPDFIAACAAGSLEICIVNDILGVMRDILHGETQGNLVLILEKYRQMSRNEALQKSCQIHDSIVKQYLSAKHRLLESLESDACFIGDLHNYLSNIETWMSGHIKWMKITKRFTQSLSSHTNTH